MRLFPVHSRYRRFAPPSRGQMAVGEPGSGPRLHLQPPGMQQRFGGDRKRGGLGQIFRTKRHAGKREAVSEVGTPRQLIADYFGDIQRARHEHTDDGRLVPAESLANAARAMKASQARGPRCSFSSPEALGGAVPVTIRAAARRIGRDVKAHIVMFRCCRHAVCWTRLKTGKRRFL
jgi:hypothetical protein